MGPKGGRKPQAETLSISWTSDFHDRKCKMRYTKRLWRLRTNFIEGKRNPQQFRDAVEVAVQEIQAEEKRGVVESVRFHYSPQDYMVVYR